MLSRPFFAWPQALCNRLLNSHSKLWSKTFLCRKYIKKNVSHSKWILSFFWCSLSSVSFWSVSFTVMRSVKIFSLSVLGVGYRWYIFYTDWRDDGWHCVLLPPGPASACHQGSVAILTNSIQYGANVECENKIWSTEGESFKTKRWRELTSTVGIFQNLVTSTLQMESFKSRNVNVSSTYSFLY